MWPVILYAVLQFMGLYALTATIFLFLAQLERNADGKLILDPNSWHFKVAYPVGRGKVAKACETLKNEYAYSHRKERAQELLASYNRGLCVYFLKFFLMLYFAWPFIVACSILWLVVGSLVVAPFGFYTALGSDSFRRYPLPRVYRKRLLPIHLIVPLLYGWLWYLYPEDTMFVTIFVTKWVAVAVGSIVGFVATVAAVIFAIKGTVSWLRHTDEGSVSMVREWVSAKKEGVCPTLKLKIPGA